MVSNPIQHPSPAKKMKCSFLDYVQLLMLPGLVDGLEPHPWLLWSQKCEMLIFGLRSTSDNQPGWSMDLNPICYPSPAIKLECSFLDYIHFWWSAGLVDGNEPHPLPLSSQKYEMLVFGLCSTFDDWPGWSMDLNTIHHPSPAKKMKCSFLGYIQLLMIDQAGRWTQTPSATPLQPKNKILAFGLCSTSDDWPGWSMDLNPIHHPSPARNMKWLFLDYVQLLMIGWAGWWTWTPSTTLLQPKKWNACFWIMLNFWWLAGLVDGLEPHAPCLSSQKNWNAHFWIMFNFLWLAGLVDGLEPHLPLLSSQKNEMFIFVLCSTSDDQPGWLMDLNPMQYPSPAKKMKCSFLDYVQLLLIDQAGQWTQNASTTPLQPKKWNAHFWITFNIWWSAGLVDGLECHPPPLCSQKNEMLIFGLHSTSDGSLGW